MPKSNDAASSSLVQANANNGARMALLTALAMLAFAGNSLLCRLALKGAHIDAATFTLMRIASAALVLWIILKARNGDVRSAGSWTSAAALVVYVVAFSYAYLRLTAGTGALLLFGAVQATMIGVALAKGDRLLAPQWLGLALALAGLVWLVLPGLSAPEPVSSMLMIVAGIGWGVYSLRGRGNANPIAATAGNFVRALPFTIGIVAIVALAPGSARFAFDASGLSFAVASGALTSGIGYVIWYAALEGLKPATAASVQLSVPLITAAGGVALLGETFTSRLVVSSIAILGGIALVVLAKRRV